MSLCPTIPRRVGHRLAPINNNDKLGVGVYAFNPNTQEAGIGEFEASWVGKVNSRPARALS